MMIKFFNTGQGAGFGPVHYLCSENPFNRGAREHKPEILKGDPEQIRKQIDAVPYDWKYSSGAVCFAPEDAPTKEQLVEVMAGFEDLVFAGLPYSSRCELAVRHFTGREEIHLVIPRQELHTGKAFNPCPPNWEIKFKHLADKFNYKYGWSRPDDPRRARSLQPSKQALIDADAKRKGKQVKVSIKERITNAIIKLIYQGTIHNRTNILEMLQGMGYSFNRINKNYITIIDPNDGKKHRLKGTLYDEYFTSETWIELQENRPFIEDIPDPKKAAEADAKLQAELEEKQGKI